MKKSFFLFFILIPLAFGCQQNPPVDTPSMINKVSASNIAAGVIPADVKMHDYVFNPQNYSWKEVDAYYRNEVLVKNRNDSYFNNLRKTTIGILVNQFDFLEKADLKEIEFYANELQAVDLPDPNVFIKVMNRLKDQWPSTQIAAAYQSLYNKNMKFIHEKLNDPQDYLGKSGESWEKIKGFASTEK